MARPTKQGIDYFPVDVQFDDKVELYVAETGAEGLGILITIWQIIYQNEGYYTNNDDNLVLLVRRRTMADIETIKNCILCAICRGIFDERKAKSYKILTSKAIQKRYIIAARKKKVVLGVGNYMYKCIIDAGNEHGNVVMDNKNTTKEEVEVKEDEEVKKKGNSHTGEKGYSEKFHLFWKEYPKNRRQRKADAFKAWKKHGCEKIFDDVMGALRLQKRCQDWMKDDGQFIPQAATWVNGRRWEDEVENQEDTAYGRVNKKWTKKD